MRRGFRAVAVSLLLTGVTVAQVGPPSCPVVRTQGQGSGVVTVVVPAARPTAQEIKATAEAGAADAPVMVAAEPVENFGSARYRIEDYADCTGGGGCYWADMEAQARRAEAALDGLVKSKKPGERLAMVLDIDETSLSAYCEMRREAYGYVRAMFESWIVTPEASVPLNGALRLFRRARAAGVAVFFITGRPEEQREATARNLRTAGYEGWTELGLKKDPSVKTQAFKAAERQKIVDAGYRLVMNVGDQWSDLNGSPKAEVSVKLPNPFYCLP